MITVDSSTKEYYRKFREELCRDKTVLEHKIAVNIGISALATLDKLAADLMNICETYQIVDRIIGQEVWTMRQKILHAYRALKFLPREGENQEKLAAEHRELVSLIDDELQNLQQKNNN